MNPDHDHQQQEPHRRPPVPETGHPPSTPAEQVETLALFDTSSRLTSGVK